MAEILPWPRSQFLDDNGNPLAGGKLYSYKAGSSIPLAVYADKAATTPHANPVVLNSRGEALIYLGVQAYKLILKDANDVTIWTHDNFVVSQTDTESLAQAIADAQAAQTAAEAAQTAAEIAKTAAETAETNAETAQTAAASSASSASTSAGTATTQAGIATTKAGEAATSASSASASASTATTQAGIATTKAGEAAASAAAAAVSAANALTSETNTATALAAHEADTTAVHGIADTALLVTTTGAQVLTAKDIDGGTASDARRITLPKNTKTNLDGLIRKEGTLVYDTVSKKPYYDNGLNLLAVGSGSGGIKNYIKTGNANDDSTGWTTYDDGIGAQAPVDGAAGSAPYLIEFGTTIVSPLEGTSSYTFSPSVGATSGKGAATDFTIDREDLGRVLEISFSYELSTLGGYNDGKLTVYIIADPTGTPTVIQPVGHSILKLAQGTPGKHKATFQALTTTQNYRLCFHSTSSTSDGFQWVMKLDSICVGPQRTVNAVPVQEFTGTTSGSWANATYAYSYQRVGGYANGTNILVTMTGAGSGNLTVTLPFSVSSAVNSSGTVEAVVGVANTTDAGIAGYTIGEVVLISPNVIQVRYNASGTNAAATVTPTSPFTFGSGDLIKISLNALPVQGWSSNVAFSSESDGRVVAAVYHTPTNTSIAATTTTDLKYGTKVQDTHGVYNTSTGAFVAPSAGFYRASASVSYVTTVPVGSYYMYLATTSGGVDQRIDLKYLSTANVNFGVAGSGTIYLNAGQSLFVTVYTPGTTTVQSIQSSMAIEKVQGPASIVAGEKVKARVYLGSNQVVTNGTTPVLAMASKSEDSHGCWDASTYKFNVNRAGTLRVRGQLLFDGATYSVGTNCGFYIFKNGASYSYAGIEHSQTTTSHYPYRRGFDAVPVLAGDTVHIVVVHSEATSRTVLGGTNLTFFEFELD